MKVGSILVLTVVLKTASIATAVYITLLPRSAAQIESDLSSASSILTTLHNALETYHDDGEPSTQLTTLHTDSQNAILALDSTTNAVEVTGAISSTDSSTIEGTVSSMETTITAICQIVLTEIHPSGSSQLLDDLSELDSAFNSLLSALQSATPISSHLELKGKLCLNQVYFSPQPHRKCLLCSRDSNHPALLAVLDHMIHHSFERDY